MTRPLPFVEPLGHGIHVVDTGFHRPRFDASYLIIENGRAAFVDAGTNHSVPRLLEALDALGLARDAVDFVIATHVHLDHAGGVGLLMRELPGARLVVHPRGARHLVDPSHLVKGAEAVYGADEVRRSYGEIVGVARERVVETADGMTLELAGRPLVFIDTPGHAMHHHCVWDAASCGWFTGDTFGLSYREFDTAVGAWIMPTTTPVQFQPEALRHSVERMLSHGPEAMYLTHFGRVGDVPRLAALLLDQLDEMVAAAKALEPGPARKDALRQRLAQIHLGSLRSHGVTLDESTIRDLLELDLELNAQGIDIWLARTEERA
ncbi:MBL fold metallo-hydrolase [Piscinibacter koreensis]|uniref:MBL fold metallo-hydrolase n=1 Tax=Piscinibacter koreensis TaxID=2742824 RepID=A0A7Y6NLE8_9BURK|nr:MBL fold metallo-hydrolase [Schlegelella koreensis]NUZ05246.1 MBL fold metallo-hydrolase [Schlegelella koreensis]